MNKKLIGILGIIIGVAIGYGINSTNKTGGNLIILESGNNQEEPTLYLYKNEESSAVASRVVSEVPSEVTSIVLSEDECGASAVTSEVVSFHASPVISFVPTEKAEETETDAANSKKTNKDPYKDQNKNEKNKQKQIIQKRKLQKVTPIVIKQLEAMERIQNPEKYKISKRERAKLQRLYEQRN